MARGLNVGEVWGVIDGHYVPCEEQTMKVLRGQYVGQVAELPKREKKELPEGQRWEKVGNDWVILNKNNIVVGGKGIHRNKILFEGALMTMYEYRHLVSRRIQARRQTYHGCFAHDPRLQKYWTDGSNGAPSEGLWSYSNGRWREIDEPID